MEINFVIHVKYYVLQKQTFHLYMPINLLRVGKKMWIDSPHTFFFFFFFHPFHHLFTFYIARGRICAFFFFYKNNLIRYRGTNLFNTLCEYRAKFFSIGLAIDVRRVYPTHWHSLFHFETRPLIPPSFKPFFFFFQYELTSIQNVILTGTTIIGTSSNGIMSKISISL